MLFIKHHSYQILVILIMRKKKLIYYFYVAVVLPNVSSEMPSYFVDEFGSVTFECTGTGAPEPVIYWSRNGSLINDTSRFIAASQNETFNSSSIIIYTVSGSLTLIGALVADDGDDYQCTASNSNGSSSIMFSLTVYCKYIMIL